MAFSRRSLKANPILGAIRIHPFILFGAPFLTLVIGASFAMQNFTQTRYDLHAQKVKSLSFDEEMGLNEKRKKVDLREEYFRLSNPGLAGKLDADLEALSLPSTSTSESGSEKAKKKRGRISFTPIDQDELENIRVPRPEGFPEWGPPTETPDDMPVKGQRKEDRWV